MKIPKASFIFSERDSILRALKYTVSDLKRYIVLNPDDYIESGDEVPSIDVRLCIDADGWIIRSGSSDYDPYHSTVCAASSVSEDTDPEELLNDLIEDALEQLSSLQSE